VRYISTVGAPGRCGRRPLTRAATARTSRTSGSQRSQQWPLVAPLTSFTTCYGQSSTAQLLMANSGVQDLPVKTRRAAATKRRREGQIRSCRRSYAPPRPAQNAGFRTLVVIVRVCEGHRRAVAGARRCLTRRKHGPSISRVNLPRVAPRRPTSPTTPYRTVTDPFVESRGGSSGSGARLKRFRDRSRQPALRVLCRPDSLAVGGPDV